jgi:site-specific DNA-cytosine methylase
VEALVKVLAVGGGQSGFDGKSRLFWEYVRILNEVKPKYFLLENVKMKQEWQDIITKELGVEPIRINSKLVSAQTRDRLYWTNIPGIEEPKDKGILLETILESGEVDRDKAYCIDANYFKGTNASQYISKSRRQIVWVIPEATKKGFVEVSPGQCIDLTFIKSKTRRGRLMLEKSNCLTASSQNLCKVTNDWFRKLTPIECERLQTVPDNYTDHVSNSQRYKMLGNGWTVDVIAHIFNQMAALADKERGEEKKHYYG